MALNSRLQSVRDHTKLAVANVVAPGLRWLIGWVAGHHSAIRTSRQNGRQIAAFDYSAEVELFPSRGSHSRPRLTGFARAADAIRVAIEELAAKVIAGAWLESGKSISTPSNNGPEEVYARRRPCRVQLRGSNIPRQNQQKCSMLQAPASSAPVCCFTQTYGILVVGGILRVIDFRRRDQTSSLLGGESRAEVAVRLVEGDDFERARDSGKRACARWP